MKKIFTLLSVIENLASIPRTGGNLYAGIKPERLESIAIHGYKVCCWSLVLGEILIKHGKDIDMNKLLKHAITHDWTDSIILDIPSGSPSYRSYFTDINIRNSTLQAEINAGHAMKEYVKDEVDLPLEYHASNDIEQVIIHLADTFAFLLEIIDWRYQGLKHEWFEYVWSNTTAKLTKLLKENSLAILQPLVDECQHAFDKGIKPANPFLTKSEFQTFTEITPPTPGK